MNIFRIIAPLGNLSNCQPAKWFLPSFMRSYTTNQSTNTTNKEEFNTELLKFLVCPISKKSLRYDKEANELVNDELGVAYPITENGIPVLLPNAGRCLNPEKEQSAS